MHTPWAIFHCVCQFAYVVTRWLCTLHKYILAHHHQNCECDSRFCEHGVETLNLTSAIDSGTFERATIAATVFCWESFRGILRTKSRWSPLGFQRYRNQSEKLNRPFLLGLQTIPGRKCRRHFLTRNGWYTKTNVARMVERGSWQFSTKSPAHGRPFDDGWPCLRPK